MFYKPRSTAHAERRWDFKSLDKALHRNPERGWLDKASFPKDSRYPWLDYRISPLEMYDAAAE